MVKNSSCSAACEAAYYGSPWKYVMYWGISDLFKQKSDQAIALQNCLCNRSHLSSSFNKSSFASLFTFVLTPSHFNLNYRLDIAQHILPPENDREHYLFIKSYFSFVFKFMNSMEPLYEIY